MRIPDDVSRELERLRGEYVGKRLKITWVNSRDDSYRTIETKVDDVLPPHPYGHPTFQERVLYMVHGEGEPHNYCIYQDTEIELVSD